MSNTLTNQLMRAVVSRYEADREGSLATIELYLNASVGIGDHPDVVEELQKAITKLAAAEEALETVKRNFLRPPEEESPSDG